MNIILIGKPGSGKGTVGSYLSKKLSLPVIVVGDLLREEVSKGTELGKEIDALISKGNFVPDETITKLILNKIYECKNGYILDGYPRNLEQAKQFKDLLECTGTHLDEIIYLDIEDNVIMDRLQNRLLCPICGKSYHTITIKPQKDGICDKCNVDLVTRKDDKPEYLLERLRIFETITKPVVDYLNSIKKVSYIDSNCLPETQIDRVMEVLKHSGGEQWKGY